MSKRIGHKWLASQFTIAGFLAFLASPDRSAAQDSVRILSVRPTPGTELQGFTSAEVSAGRLSFDATHAVAVNVEYEIVSEISTAAVQAYYNYGPVRDFDGILLDDSGCRQRTSGSGRCTTYFSVTCGPGSPSSGTVSEIAVNLLGWSGNWAGDRSLASDVAPTTSYRFRCPEPARPDLIVSLRAPSTLVPGTPLGSGTVLTARNIGAGPAPGTVGSLDPPNGYMIDLVLSRDTLWPSGFATYSPTYREDVLLRGGRTSNTHDLASAESGDYPDFNAAIAADTPPGDYYLCARIDPGGVVAESNESNNGYCNRVEVRIAAHPLKDRVKEPPSRISPPQRIPSEKAPKPNVTPSPDPGIVKRPPPAGLDPGVAEGVGACPDPATTVLFARLARKTAPTRGFIQIVGIARNVSRAAYVSEPGQQTVELVEEQPGNPPRVVRTQAFTILAPNGTVRLVHRRGWDTSTEFQPRYRLRLVYDPDIRLDANPRNDDCGLGNNEAVLEPERINALFR